MTKTIVITGYGPGISHAVAERFGKEGFQVVLAARTAKTLEQGAQALKAKRIEVRTVATDASKPESVRALIASVLAKEGGVDVIHWNAAAPIAGDVLTASVEELRQTVEVGAFGLVEAVQAALPSLKSRPGSAVLVTDGGFGLDDEGIDAVAVNYNAMGLALANATKHKLVRLLSKRLEKEGVFAGEVMVTGTVKGTAWDTGNAQLEASAIAEDFWKLYRERKQPLRRHPAM